MNVLEFLGVFGGLALFLHGMQMMSAVQSSSATTVMVVGFVNAGIMTLNQAVWLIMGANVGTTITGLLIALDVGALAPVAAFAGVFLMVFVKEAKLQHIGQILAGLGILFTGMDAMSAAMAPLREVPAFLRLMSTLSNPLLGILFGAAFTALIQSSSASVGILQSLAAGGIVPFSGAVYVLFGQNIGTCITSVLASLGTSRSAKRATCIHLLFNVIGTVVFTVLVMVFPITQLIEAAVPSPKAEIAVMHVIFNLATTAMLLPLGNSLARLATLLLPDQEEAQPAGELRLAYLTPITAGGKEGGLGVSAIVVDQLRNELHRMLEMARQNVDTSFKAVLDRDASPLDRVEQREAYIDFLNQEISRYVSRLIAIETNEQGSQTVSSFFTIAGNIERIADHADNLAGYTRLLVGKEITFSPPAREEIGQMRDVTLRAVSALLSGEGGTAEWLSQVAQLEQRIDDMTRSFRRNQLDRMQAGACSAEACILYSELLTDFERIGDHVLNIAEELAKARTTL